MIRAYFNEKAAIWDKTVAKNDSPKLKRMAERLNIKPGSIVLDVGTGTGVFIPFLLREVGRDGKVVALDFAERMLAQAWAKGFNGNIDYLCAGVTDIPLRSEIFDIIVCHSSFPHFPHKSGDLTEMSRVIKKGGRLLICHTSNRARINERHRQIPAVENDIIPDGNEMQSLLSAAGFTDIKIEDDSESYLASARKPK